MHDCPHPDCDIQIPWSMFACRKHWLTLPQRIKTGILAAWRKVSNGNADGIAEHDAACAEAMAYWADAA